MLQKIEVLTSKVKFSKLKSAAEELSAGYRSRRFRLKDEEHFLAYLLTRLPATFAALQSALRPIRQLPITSLLDLGAGPGTGWLAAKEIFSLQKGTFVETDPAFILLGEELVEDDVSWVQGDLCKMVLEPHDLVLFSYSIGELDDWEKALESAWKAAGQALVIIEPGTPQSFIRMKQVREKLIGMGAHIAAPCPHEGACPSSWCHFAARLERSQQHRLAKEGSLGYEDEKFSYLAAVRQPVSKRSRIVRHPVKRKGHVVFELCTEQGIEKRTVVKNDKDLYKRARKLQWGDTL